MAQICQRLDGIPLAIELAAAKVRVLTPREIADRLDSRFQLLTGGTRDALPRHQTLRALIDWSYELLSEDEIKLLQRLSVFAGGWTLEAAEGVCAGNGIELLQVLDLLSQLVAKSLVVAEQPEERGYRYRMLETIRQYGSDRLAGTGEQQRLQQAHARYYLAFAERAEAELMGPRQGEWFEAVEQEHDNLREILRRFRDRALADEVDEQLGLRIAVALYWFWTVRNYWSEGREWLTAMLSLPSASQPSPTRARGAIGAGYLATLQGDHDAAAPLLEQGLNLGREMFKKGDPVTAGFCLGFSGYATLLHGDLATAESVLSESVRVLGGQDVKWMLPLAQAAYGTALHLQGKDVEATSSLEAALRLSRAENHTFGAAFALSSLGVIAIRAGDHDNAVRYLEESVTLFQQLRNFGTAMLSVTRLGQLALKQGDAPKAGQGAAGPFRDAGGGSGPSTRRWPGWVRSGLERYRQLARRYAPLGGCGAAARNPGSESFAGWRGASRRHTEVLERTAWRRTFPATLVGGTEHAFGRCLGIRREPIGDTMTDPAQHQQPVMPHGDLSKDKPKGRRWILSLDGGGVRGVITLRCLQRLEQYYGAKVGDMFDLFVGTSTGSIIAALLAAGRTIEQILPIYDEESRRNAILRATTDKQRSGVRLRIPGVRFRPRVGMDNLSSHGPGGLEFWLLGDERNPATARAAGVNSDSLDSPSTTGGQVCYTLVAPRRSQWFDRSTDRGFGSNHARRAAQRYRPRGQGHATAGGDILQRISQSEERQ